MIFFLLLRSLYVTDAIGTILSSLLVVPGTETRFGDILRLHGHRRSNKRDNLPAGPRCIPVGDFYQCLTDTKRRLFPDALERSNWLRLWTATGRRRHP